MKTKMYLILLSLSVAVIISGCLEQTDQFIKHPYIPGISAGDKPITDSEKIIGKWIMPDSGAAQNGYETSYTFNKGHTGEKVDLVYGESFFNYELFQNKIILTNIKPCKGFDTIPDFQDLSTNPCEKRDIKYEFQNDETLIISNTVFEKK